MPQLFAHYVDEGGNRIDLQADSIEALAAELPEDYAGPRITVLDEPGFARGWIGGRNDWRAQ